MIIMKVLEEAYNSVQLRSVSMQRPQASEEKVIRGYIAAKKIERVEHVVKLIRCDDLASRICSSSFEEVADYVGVRDRIYRLEPSNSS